MNKLTSSQSTLLNSISPLINPFQAFIAHVLSPLFTQALLLGSPSIFVPLEASILPKEARKKRQQSVRNNRLGKIIPLLEKVYPDSRVSKVNLNQF